jgi:hypothetical protein
MAQREELSLGLKIKSRIHKRVGVIKEFALDADSVIVEFEEMGTYSCKIGDIEKLAVDEHELMKQYKAAVDKEAELKEKTKEATSARVIIEGEILEHLERQSKDQTDLYGGIGRAVRTKVEVRASITEENRDKAFDNLRKIGREDLLKLTVSPATLSVFVSECLDKGKPIPEGISHYLQPILKLKAK